MIHPRRKTVSILRIGAVGVVATLAFSACASGTLRTGKPVSAERTTPPAATGGPSGVTDPGNGAEGADLTIKGFEFAPATITVKAGSTLTWTNLDLVGHTVTAVEGLFGSRLLQNGEVFEVTLDEPGAYAYFCAVHPVMSGTIEVVS